MATPDARIAVLESQQKTSERAHTALFEYMKEGNDQRAALIGQVSGLASKIESIGDYIERNEKSRSDYEKECDTERKDHEKRITKGEGFQSRQLKWVGALSLIGGAFTDGICQNFTTFKAWIFH
jgi:chromosome segregation ATPase